MATRRATGRAFRVSSVGMSGSGGSRSGGAARRALLVVNAGSRGGQDEAEAYVAALADPGLVLVRRACPKADALTPLIRSMQGEVDCVILGGGDGTMSAAAVGLRDTGLPLGILPLGTGNDLARTVGVPDDPAGAAAVILGGRTRTVDLGCVNGHMFFNVASLGLTVDVSRRLTKAAKRRFGKLAYVWTAFRVVMGSRRFGAVIRSDEATRRVRTMQIAVGNGRFYGGGMVVSTAARIDDHMLDVYSLEPRSKWRLLLAARAFRDGEHGKVEDIRTLRTAVIEVVTRRPRPVSADGEIVTETPARFSVLADAVRVYAP